MRNLFCWKSGNKNSVETPLSELQGFHAYYFQQVVPRRMQRRFTKLILEVINP